MEITIPHKFTPRDYQLPLMRAMDNGIKRAVITWHRRSGKDKTSFNYMVKKAVEEVGNYFYFFPTGELARKALWENIDNDGNKMLEHIPEELIKRKLDNTMFLELKNGSTIQIAGSDKFEKRNVGTNPKGVVLSEYAVTEPQVWNFLRPILAVNKGWIIFNSTPRGKNHHFDLVQQHKNDAKWFVETLSVDDTKVIDEETLQEEKRDMPEAIYQQEYECKFIDGATQVFRNIESVCTLESDNYINGHRYQIGVDLAKYMDYTVISVFDLMTFEQVYMDRFNQIDWNLQESKIEAIYHKFNKPEVFIDATGVGDPIVENLERKGIKVVPYKFTSDSREQLLQNLSILIESERIRLLDNEVLKDELGSFSYELTARGRLQMKVPDNTHDDTVFSTALSVFGIPDKPVAIKSENRVRYLMRDFKNNNVVVTSYE